MFLFKDFEYDLDCGNIKIISMIVIKDFLIINCTGKNDKIGLRVNSNFFIHDFQTKILNNEILVSTILNLTNKHKAKIDKYFTVLVNNGPGRFSTIRVALAVAKGIEISKSVKLFGFKDADLPSFSQVNIDILVKKNLIEKKLIKPLYLS
jgi:hypothetical protein